MCQRCVNGLTGGVLQVPRARNAKVSTDSETVQLTKADFEKLARDANLAQEAGITDETDIDEDELAVLREMEGAAETQWRVTKTLPLDEMGHVATLPTAALDIDSIARKYGPGKYKIRGRRADGQWTVQRTITISPVAALKTEHAPANGGASGVADVLQIIKSQKDQDSAKVKEWLLPLLTLLAPSIAEIFKGMFTRKEERLSDMVTALQGLKSMQEPAPTPADPLKQVEQFARIMETVRGVLPEKESTGSTWVDLVRDGIREGLPVLGTLFAGRLSSPTGAPFVPATSALPGQAASVPRAAAPSQPSAQPTAQNGAAAAGASSEGNPMLQLLEWFKNQLPMLTMKAGQSADPTLYADLLLDNLPPGSDVIQIRKFLVQDNWWQLLMSVHPAVTPYSGWFLHLRNSLLESIDEAQRERDIELQNRIGEAGVDVGEA